MAEFSIQGSTDPFLAAELAQGETVVAEGGAMAAMDHTIVLTGKAKGGVLKSLARAATTGESFFMQHATAQDGPGRILFAPGHPGEVRVVELNDDSWSLTDGAFLCAEDSLEIATKRNKSMSGSFFGGTGGFFIMNVSGTGKLVVSALGAIQEMAIPKDGELIVDSGHVVGWPSTAEMTASLSTGQGGGILGKMVGSVKTGEGVVLRFKGTGKILVASRAQPAFIGWISSRIPKSS
ncbi:MAG: TIGR00266 family protein [Phycisphaerales bacterium]|nr:TIGR00266 family protein [Phycisphaerales bacterium]